MLEKIDAEKKSNGGNNNLAPTLDRNNANTNRIERKSSRSNESLTSEQGFFRKALPVMPKPLAVVCCVFNILFPGLGTFISSLSVFFCATHGYDTNMKAFLVNFLAFVMQLCSAIIIFGWIWSIKYGLLFIQLSNKTEGSNIEIEPDLPLFVRRHSSMDTSVMYQPKSRLSGIALAKVYENEHE